MKRKNGIWIIASLLLLSSCDERNHETTSSFHTNSIFEKMQTSFTAKGSLTIQYLSIGKTLDFPFVIKICDDGWYKYGYDTAYEEFYELPIYKQNEQGIYKSLDYKNELTTFEYGPWSAFTNPFKRLKETDFSLSVSDNAYHLDVEIDNLEEIIYPLTGNAHHYESISFQKSNDTFSTVTIKTLPELNQYNNSMSYIYSLEFSAIGETSLPNIAKANPQNNALLANRLLDLKQGNYSIKQEIVRGDHYQDSEVLSFYENYQVLNYYYDETTILCEFHDQDNVLVQDGLYVAKDGYMYSFNGTPDQLDLGSSDTNTLAENKPPLGDISADFFIKSDDAYEVNDPYHLVVLASGLYLDLSFDYFFLTEAQRLKWEIIDDSLVLTALFLNEDEICTLKNTIYDVGATEASSRVDLSSYFTKDGFKICDLFIGTWQGTLRDNYTGEYLDETYTLVYTEKGEIFLNDEPYTITDFQESMNEGGTYAINNGTFYASFYYQNIASQGEPYIILTTDDLKYQVKMARV